MSYDFEFSRQLLTLTVGATGGSLGSAVLQGTTTNVTVKTILDVGTFDDNGNLRAAEWTTTGESYERQRSETPHWGPRYPRDGENVTTGRKRFVFRNETVDFYPKSDDTNETYDIGLEVYTIASDWTVAHLNPETLTVAGTLNPNVIGTYTRVGNYNQVGAGASEGALYRLLGQDYFIYRINDANWVLQDVFSPSGSNGWALVTTVNSPVGTYTPFGTNTGTATVTQATAATSDVWTTYGSQYLIWATTVFLNKRFKFYVARTEGNLAPPEDLAAAGLQSLKEWATGRYEQYNRHGK